MPKQRGASIGILVGAQAAYLAHHGRARSNVNYSLLFTFFDRLFGTYEAPTSSTWVIVARK
jgi:sterol desaturase/sphingolipid hydroxylase (fatty acid hydroxylase superfamily)